MVSLALARHIAGLSKSAPHDEAGADHAVGLAEGAENGTPNVKEFRGGTAGSARCAASAWLSDFTAHGPLQIDSMQTTAHDGCFITAVFYHQYRAS